MVSVWKENEKSKNEISIYIHNWVTNIQRACFITWSLYTRKENFSFTKLGFGQFSNFIRKHNKEIFSKVSTEYWFLMHYMYQEIGILITKYKEKSICYPDGTLL